MNTPQHLHRSSAMGSTVGHIPANSWASCLEHSVVLLPLVLLLLLLLLLLLRKMKIGVGLLP